MFKRLIDSHGWSHGGESGGESAGDNEVEEAQKVEIPVYNDKEFGV